MLLTMAFKKVKRNGGKPAVQNLVYVCNINFMFILCLCLVYEATSCVKKQKSFCACVYDVRIVQYDWSNNRSQALFKTIDHSSRLPNKDNLFLIWAKFCAPSKAAGMEQKTRGKQLCACVLTRHRCATDIFKCLIMIFCRQPIKFNQIGRNAVENLDKNTQCSVL